MSAELWKKALCIQSLVEDLNPEERDRVIAAECGEDATLRSYVLDLIAESEAFDDQEEPDSFQSLRPGEFLGPYQVLRLLGEGGMGAVYLALRTDDARLRVDAVKILPGEHLSLDRLARAVREGETLRNLQGEYFPEYRDHDQLPDGRPYLAMEFIDGLPIDQYCDQNQLSLTERLQLFLHVCEAVTSAHQSLILHRDLKPSNILVTSDGIPKILDFGIAKLLAPDGVAARTLTAGLKRPHYSPNYASPEQVEGAQLTTASDVYSLGVLLYLLLCGRVPLQLGHLATDHGRLLSELKTQEPLPPSKQQKGVENKSPVLSWGKVLKGDLDTIVLKTLARDPQQRYAQVSNLAEDIRRYLTHRPILAQRPTLRYRAGRFLKRHRVAVAFVALFLAMLSLGSIAVFQQYQETVRERDRAGVISEFMIEIFSASHPDDALGTIPTARTLLDTATAQIGDRFENDPLLHADLLSALARSFLGLGLAESARGLQEQEIQLREEFGDQGHSLALARSTLGLNLFHSGKYDEAHQVLARALSDWEEISGTETLDYAETLHNIAIVQRGQGDYAAAAETHRQALAIRRTLLPQESIEVSVSLSALATALRFQQKYEEALPYAQEALKINRVLTGPVHPHIVGDLNEVAVLLRNLGRLAEAEAHFQEAIEQGNQVYPSGHPNLATVLNNAGLAAMDRGDAGAAEQRYRRSLEMSRAFQGEGHPYLAPVLSNLGRSLLDQQRFEEASKAYQEALEVASASLEPDHPSILRHRAKIGYRMWLSGERREGAQIFEEMSTKQRALVDDDAPVIATDLLYFAIFREAEGSYTEAEHLAREALQRDLSTFAPEHKHIARDQHRLASILFQLGKFNECADLARKALTSNELRLQPDHWRVDESRNVLGACLIGLGDLKTGSKLFEESMTALQDKLGVENSRLGLAHDRLQTLERLAQAGKTE